MGREIKRVLLNFNWPLNKVWGGYKNPFYCQSIECMNCQGSGYSLTAEILKNKWYGYAKFKPEDRGSIPFLPTDQIIIDTAKRNNNSLEYYESEEDFMTKETNRLCKLFNKAWCHHINETDIQALIKTNRLYNFTHIWTKENEWKKKDPPYIPAPKEVNEWSIKGFGHDSINQWICVKAECERLEVSYSCEQCNGEGALWPTPEIKKQSEDWKRIEPPKGKGFQLWETVSEGSPISPVFEKPEQLAEWLVHSPDYKWRKNDQGTTYEQWLKFIAGPGCAPSGIVVNGQFMTGVQAVK